MLREFIDFVDSVLPSVSPDFRDGAKVAISQFEKDGKLTTFHADAMVISTSCHIDQKDKLLMVPVFPISSFSGNLVELKKNMVFDFMYLPDSSMNEKYICFNLMTSYDKRLICQGIENGKIRRIASLNQLGYYFFIIKLTVYLMRKEDSDTLASRES